MLECDHSPQRDIQGFEVDPNALLKVFLSRWPKAGRNGNEMISVALQQIGEISDANIIEALESGPLTIGDIIEIVIQFRADWAHFYRKISILNRSLNEVRSEIIKCGFETKRAWALKLEESVLLELMNDPTLNILERVRAVAQDKPLRSQPWVETQEESFEEDYMVAIIATRIQVDLFPEGFPG